jgi:hypothetical protein
MSGPFKRLSDSLGPLLAGLEQRAREMQDLTARVRAIMPSPEKEHLMSASYRGDTLVISMDSAAWCSRLRYDEKALLAALHKAGETKAAKIKVRVGRAG